MSLYFVLNLEYGHGHLDAQILYLLASGNDTSVVVGQNDKRDVFQVRPEQPLTTGIKVIAINDSERTGHDLRRL
jgi:hypothetical protein